MATPRVVISTRSSPVLALHQWRHVCDHAGVGGVDLDIAQSLRRRLLLRGLSGELPDVQSVWMGQNPLPLLTPNLLEYATVVVPFERLNSRSQKQAVDPQAISALRLDLPESAQIVIALAPLNREGTRTHLDRISALRHVAEEWDVHIALDLTGPIDPRWEAEAAVLRLDDRLRLVRFVPPSFERAHVRYDLLHTREVSVGRVLAAIADFGFGPILSLKIPLPFWDWTKPIAIAEQFILARNATLARYQVKTGPLSTPPKRV